MHRSAFPPSTRLTRRGFVAAWGAAGLAGCAAPSVLQRIDRPEDRVGWIDRLTWGVDSASLADLSRLSLAGFVDAQLEADAAAPSLPPEVQARVDALGCNQRSMSEWALVMDQRRKDADALADVDARRTAQQEFQRDLTGLARDAASQCLFQALYSRQQLREQLGWFWFNHFNVHQSKRDVRVLVVDYQAQLRRRALGRFQDLLIASATHPAMLRYLDNDQNATRRPNENFAREVMELHTLGVDAGYTQKDVQELARVLTGLGVNFGDRTPAVPPALRSLYVRQGATEFNPTRHDMATKLVLGATVNGRGWDEILDTLVRLARHPATARHISHQLAVYFCADTPDAALVDRMARAFTASDGRIDVTVRAMVESPAFGASLGRKFKDPLHYVVSAVRLAYDGRTVVDTGPMQGWINRLGEGLYNRQTPDGYPLDASAWTASGQMSTRFDIARAIGGGNAGLFRPAGDTTTPVQASPRLFDAVRDCGVVARLGASTRAALDGAANRSEWNALLLSSPEFMVR